MDDTKWLKDALDKIESKVDRLDQRLDDQGETLVEQSVILNEHIRRTAASERRIEMLQKNIQPMNSHIAKVEGIFKGLGLITVLAGIAKVLLPFILN